MSDEVLDDAESLDAGRASSVWPVLSGPEAFGVRSGEGGYCSSLLEPKKDPRVVESARWSAGLTFMLDFDPAVLSGAIFESRVVLGLEFDPFLDCFSGADVLGAVFACHDCRPPFGNLAGADIAALDVCVYEALCFVFFGRFTFGFSSTFSSACR